MLMMAKAKHQFRIITIFIFTSAFSEGQKRDEDRKNRQPVDERIKKESPSRRVKASSK
jgi:hypothetical protein